MSNRMTADECQEHARDLVRRAMGKLLMLRRQFPDAAEFGVHAAQVVDTFVIENKAIPVIRQGRWDDAEREALKAAYLTNTDCNSALTVASQNIFRTRSQIYSMARNMGLA